MVSGKGFFCVLVLALLAACTACSKANEHMSADPTSATSPGTSASVAPAEPTPPPDVVLRKWTGDFDAMKERRLIRALVVPGKMFYFIDKGQEKGVSHDALMEFEKEINSATSKGPLKVQIAIVPVTRDEIIPALLEGRGDIAAANLTSTEGRRELVDFSNPLLSDVKELVVTGPNSPPLSSLDDLAGKEVMVRASSSYAEHLRKLNESFKKSGKAPVKIVNADEQFEDEDILEMVNAGIVPITVVDSHVSDFWMQVLEKLKVHSEIVLHSGNEIAWAFRKDSPKLKEAVNAFVDTHKKGTLFGNMMLKRYLASADWIKNSTSEEELKKFNAMVDVFKAYGRQYDFEWLLLAAQGYQESGLDQNKKSHVGAVGVMQVLPTTASDARVNITAIDKVENNIHAGAKYLRFVMDEFFKDERIPRREKFLFAIASYNAGPAKIARLRHEAATMGLDPNVWFNNVEVVAGKEIGRETVQYVSNIYKYYFAYKAVNAQKARKKAASKQN